MTRSEDKAYWDQLRGQMTSEEGRIVVAGHYRTVACLKKSKLETVIIASDYRSLSDQEGAKAIRKRVEKAAVGSDCEIKYPVVTARQLARRLRLRRPAMVVGILRKPEEFPRPSRKGRRRKRNREWAKKRSRQHCPVCARRIRRGGKLDACKHRGCFTCIRDLALSQLKKKNVFAPTCPYCRTAFTSIKGHGNHWNLEDVTINQEEKEEEDEFPHLHCSRCDDRDPIEFPIFCELCGALFHQECEAFDARGYCTDCRSFEAVEAN